MHSISACLHPFSPTSMRERDRESTGGRSNKGREYAAGLAVQAKPTVYTLVAIESSEHAFEGKVRRKSSYYSIYV